MDDGLLERDRELAALERLIEGARDEGGRVVLIEGPAGIGKTRLLGAAREHAARGMTVLTARCSELEREFSFGAVRQLFEPVARDAERRARLLAGAAAPVEGVLGAPEGDAEGTFAVLHGLYWATLNLAEERPVLIAIDDLQWSDRPSLRFIAYLAARLEGAPVLVAASVRSTDPGTDPQLLAEIAADPLTDAVRPGPLGEASVGELIHGRLGEPTRRSREACLEATGGNPLLLRHVLIALEQDGVRPTAAGAAAVRGIGSRAVSRTVLLRLSRLREEAAAVARAVAVLGESSKLPAVAALTGPRRGRGRARGRRAGAGGHPAARAAARLRPPARARRRLPRRAGRRARAASTGARPTCWPRAHAADEEVAAQLVHAPRRGDPATVDRLRAAARESVRRGGPENAMVYLARALEEPPPPAICGPSWTSSWGSPPPRRTRRSRSSTSRAPPRSSPIPALRAIAAFALAQSQLFIGGAKEGGALARRTAAELGPELADLRQMLDEIELLSVFFGYDPGALDRLAHYREARDGDGLGAKMIAAATAFAWGAGGGPAAEVEALALEAYAGGELLTSGNGLSWSAAMVAPMLSESPRATEIYRATREEAYRRGSRFAMSSSEMFEGAYLLLAAGDLEQGGEAVRISLRLQELWGSDATGEVVGARARRAARAPGRRRRGGRARPSARRRPAATSPTAPTCGAEHDGGDPARRRAARRGTRAGRADGPQRRRTCCHPDWKPWQSLKARALAQLGRRDEAMAAMTAELELARTVGGDRVIGRCLRQLGELEGEAGEPRLHEAVELLSRTPARLELARALAALGALQRRTRRPTEAREPLRQALELAEKCACPPLVEAVRSELYATGARPRTAALGGVEALTARELRVATMAADGPHQPRDRAGALRHAQDGRGAPVQRVPQAGHQLTARAHGVLSDA